MNAILRYSCALLAVVGLTAPAVVRAEAAKPPQKDGLLIVKDAGKLFSQDGIKKARDEFAQLKSVREREVMILTMATLPAAEKDRLAKIEGANLKDRFWLEFTKSEAKSERAKGIFILICRSPGRIEIIADKVMREGGFNDAKEERIKEFLLTSFKDAKDKPDSEALAIRDKALLDAVSVLRHEVPVATDAKGGQSTGKKEAAHKEGSNIGSYICIGLACLLGLWLVIGLIRAFSGGGGGGSAGGGPGGGGGGGGFLTGLMGGLFGAMAGMWIYNSFFGDHSSSAFGGDNVSGGDYGNNAGETGAGDFSDDRGTGGDFDGGGGDAAGGGGDWGGGGGGGGDWGGGGGGGDFGGGGGDF